MLLFLKHLNLSQYRKQIIMLLDSLILIGVSLMIFLIIPNENQNLNLWLYNIGILLICTEICQGIFKTYDSLWRYAQSREYLSLLCGMILSGLCYLAVTRFLNFWLSGIYVLSTLSVSLLAMLSMRFIYRMYRSNSIAKQQNGKIKVAIIGAGGAGALLLNEMLSNPNSQYKPFCFFDDDIAKIGKYIRSIPIYGPIKELPDRLKNSGGFEIILAIPSLSLKRKQEVLKICNPLQAKVRILPNILDLEDFNLTEQIREIRIEDLLEREPVSLINKQAADFLNGKVIMVTGGGGSIGSELCRQIAAIQPKQLIVVDIYENNAYDLQQQLKEKYHNKLNVVIEIASVRDKKKINQIFAHYHPQIVFHAAAHKHVPLMEHCPDEAIKNNVFGTYHVAHAADHYGVEKFILISTDKAVNPTNIMGATKRLCELIMLSMKHISKTEFTAVRFGNVLGSNGSVVPLFKRQIEHGGPVTVTDKRIIRYFMTIPEASQLVMTAASFAHSGEVFVLDMGQPVKILHLAENMIRLSGYEPYKEISIVETGLRPGEKLYEELLVKNEQMQKTANKKIYIERQSEIKPIIIEKKLNALDYALQSESIDLIYQTMHDIVPTYKTPEEVNGQYASSENEERKILLYN